MPTKRKSNKKPIRKKKPQPETKEETFFTNRGVYHKEAHAAFIRWDILTKKERKEDNEPATQKAFAQKWNLDEGTIVDWRKRTDYLKLRGDAFRNKLSRETPEVISDLRKRIKKYGSAFEVELWLNYVEAWDRKQVLEIKPPLEFGEGDIRALVTNLPPDKKKMYLQTLAKLIADAKQAEIKKNEQPVGSKAI